MNKNLKIFKQRKFLKAFTLIELIIIVAVIIILGLIAYTQLEQRGPARARDSKRVSELNTLRNALQLYYIDHGRFPTSTDSETECWVGAPPSDPHYCPYLRQELVPDYIKDLPKDPLYPKQEGSKIYTYRYISTSSGQGYTLRTDLETEKPFVISSTGGFAMPTNGGSGGGPSIPFVSFDQSSYSVNEDAGTITIQVDISSPAPAGGASVDFSTQDNTATGGGACGAGVDYVSVSQTLTWSTGDFSPKTVTIQICDDYVYEGNEIFEALLSHSHNVTISGINPISVTIVDPLFIHHIVAYETDIGVDRKQRARILKVENDWSISLPASLLEFGKAGGDAHRLTAIGQVVDSDHYLVVWSDSSNRGLAVVLEVHNDYSLSTSSEIFEFAPAQGTNPLDLDISSVDSTHYLVVYSGAGNNGVAVVVEVNSGDYSISTSSEYFTFSSGSVGARFPTVSSIITSIGSKSYYLVTYSDRSSKLRAEVLEVDVSTWSISDFPEKIIDPIGRESAISSPIDSDHYLVVYRGGSANNGHAIVVEVHNDWSVSTSSVSFEFDPFQIKWPDISAIDHYHHLVVYQARLWTQFGTAVVLKVNKTNYSVSTSSAPNYFAVSGETPAVSPIRDQIHYLVSYTDNWIGGGSAVVLEVTGTDSDWSISNPAGSTLFESSAIWDPALSPVR